DISAFLPILGTDQCERHVGEALSRGFLYAAATPLSLFGCLGIVKAGAAILFSSISPQIAQMFVDAGFKLEGSIAAMIGRTAQRASTTLVAEQNRIQYLAGQRLLELLEEQHIDKSKAQLSFHYYDWNIRLCIWTFCLACLSVTPYIRMIIQNQGDGRSPPTWTYPLIRIVGSAVSVVVAQMIIQERVQQIFHQTLEAYLPQFVF
ncbi:hypothetical protein C8R46DRAFT_898823, partial [Mycena filopes]